MDEIAIFLQLNELYAKDYLRSVSNQTYSKGKLHLFVNMSESGDYEKQLLEAFLNHHEKHYGSVFLNSEPKDDIRQASVNHAIDLGTHYFSIDANIILHPHTLQKLYDLRLEVVAPMLTFDGQYSNFHAYVDNSGYYASGENYHKILRRELKGIYNVPVVNGCYLVRHACLKEVRYRDTSSRAEYVIFSDRLRKQLIPQYIDNRSNYGTLLSYAGKTNDDIHDNDILNNKEFYLNLRTIEKKGVLCDIEWLSTFIAFEHYYLIRLLHDLYGFDIINCKQLDFNNLETIQDLNTYDVLLTAYHLYTKMPLDRLSAFKMYKMDDLENDSHYTSIAKFYIRNADVIISPYEPVFHKYHHHEDVVWVPYSCALEGLENHERILFNDTPRNKVLLSGQVGSSYPFRRYAASLDDELIDKIPHPGYQPHSVDSEATIRVKYYQKLNEYICCFTDASCYGFVLLKNFEIASVGALLLTDKTIEAQMNALGFFEKHTCIFCDQETFLVKVLWILDEANRHEVDEIRRAGMALVRERHLTRHRAAQIDRLAIDRLASRG